MASEWIIFLSAMGAFVLLIIYIYNRLIMYKMRSKEAWAQIDVQLKKRADMIPNLVETVKGYAAHEKGVLENVTKARAMLQDAPAGNTAKIAEANNMLTGALKSLFAVTENYPNLKADQSFKALQDEIAATESRIAYARQFFNECIMVYNQYQQVFPAVMFAALFGHKQAEFFQAEEADRKVPEVKF